MGLKKNLKQILALALVLLQLFVLCGCKALDTMRANQAYYDADGNIFWNGSVYKPLPACDDLMPDIDHGTTVCITEADVPVLLSATFTLEKLTPSKDKVILLGEGYWAEGRNYCREDKYQQICERIKNGFETELVCYSYGHYDEEKEEYVLEDHVLSQEQWDALKLITETVEPTEMGEGWYLDYDWTVELEECSADKLFRRQTLDIAVAGQQYYLLLYTDTHTLTFAVPDGCKATFDEIVKPYLEASGFYWENPDGMNEDVDI